MTAVYDRHGVTVHHGDCVAVLSGMPPGSVHAVVCDPPYNLSFMGREWDTHDSPAAFQEWCRAWAVECLRVLRPGGHLLAFGGTRTAHRLTSGVEDAGFEIRDVITWMYGSGFPKSLDVSKAIDKAAGAEREVIGEHHRHGGGSASSDSMSGDLGTASVLPLTAPATDAAREWAGWGTALKPASEPIIVARKPLSGTVAANVIQHGTGALNVDACRIDSKPRTTHAGGNRQGTHPAPMDWGVTTGHVAPGAGGRWPSNVVLSHSDECADVCQPGCPVAELDAQSGIRLGFASQTDRVSSPKLGASGIYGEMEMPAGRREGFNDSGGASRFFPTFRYEPKAPAAERPKLHGQAHPTVKPLGLMRWLVRLVTPPGGIVCDPFAGTGTTGHAARAEGFRAVLIELDDDHIPLIVSRLDGYRDVSAAPVDEVTGRAEPMDLLDLLAEGEAS